MIDQFLVARVSFAMRKLHGFRLHRDFARSGFVAGGYERVVAGVESEARRVVESKYADEWNASGIFKRWKLQRKMYAEIAALIAEKMPDVSAQALF